MKAFKTFLLSSLTFIAVSIVLVTPFENNYVDVSAYTNGDASTYYNGIDASLPGNELLRDLRSLNSKKHQRYIDYSNLNDYFSQTDPGTNNGQVSSFYTGKSVSLSQCNKEHVWPNSHGGNLVEDDLHMVRPTLKADNSSRGNSFYVEGMETEYDGWDPACLGNESYRGDSARIIFYCVVASSKLSLLNVNKHYTTSENNDNKMGRLSHLLKWNLEYPVQQREKVRNEAAEKIQGNRNPFIDHPEYACKIWGNADSETKQICERANIKAESITISTKEIELEVGEDFDVVYEIKPTEVITSLYWESTYEDVASVTDGLVTALKPGKTTISVSIDGTDLYDTCEVTVKGDSSGESGGTTTNNNKGCGGDINTTSILIASTSLLSIGLLYLSHLLRKKNEK